MPAVVAARMMTLARLARVKGRDHPSVLLTTVNAILQRVPEREHHRQAIALGRARQYSADGRHHPMARVQRFQPRRHGARSRRLCSTRRHRRSVRARHGRAGAARLFRRHAGIDPQFRSGDPAHQCRLARARSGADGGVPAHQRHHSPLSHRLCRGLRRRRTRRRALRSGERRPPPRRHGALAAAVPQKAGDAVRLCRRDPDRHRAARRGSRA